MGSVPEEVSKVSVTALEAMKSVPLAVALLAVNCAFLGLTGWILSSVASNASERNQQQMELITRLVTDIRDCRLAPKTNSLLRLYPPPPTLPIGIRD